MIPVYSLEAAFDQAGKPEYQDRKRLEPDPLKLSPCSSCKRLRRGRQSASQGVQFEVFLHDHSSSYCALLPKELNFD